MANRIKQFLKYFLPALFILLLVVIWTFPIFLEYYIEKNDVNWTGREIEMADIDLNLFTGEFKIYDGKVYENDNSTVFISFSQLDANVQMSDLLSSSYILEYLTITQPYVRIAQNQLTFNFDDLLASRPGDEPEESTEPVKFRIQNITLNNGSFDYEDLSLPALLQLEQISITIPVVEYGSSHLNYTCFLAQKEGGELDVKGIFDWEEELSITFLDMKSWNLEPYQNYLDSYLNIHQFSGKLNGLASIGVDYSKEGYVATSGNISLSDFLVIDSEMDSLLRWDNLSVVVDTVNSAYGMYNISDALLDRPRVLFKYFETGDNFSRLYADTISNEALDTLTVSQTEIVFENPFQYITEYIYYFFDDDVLYAFQTDSMNIRNGELIFQDYSHLEDAVVVLDNLSINVNKVIKSDSTISLNFESQVNETGQMFGNLLVARSNLSNYQFNFEIQDFYISAFDPYTRHYTAHPMWEGNVNLTSSTTVIDNYLTSNNDLLILQPEVGKKLDIEGEYTIPLRFAFGLLKDVQGNVDLNFPIEGDLNDPEYKLGRVILKVIMNLLTKAVASPYNLLARALDANEEDLKAIRFDPDQDSLANPQYKSMDLLVRVLENKEDLVAKLEYVMDEKREREEIAVKFAKKQVWQSLPDSLKMSAYKSAESIDNRDSLFVKYLDKEVGGLGTRSVAQMSIDFMGENALRERIDYLRSQHLSLVSAYLFTEKGMEEGRIQIVESADPERVATVVRPTFHILFDVAEYGASDVGPEPSSNVSPLSPSPNSDSTRQN